MNIFVIGDDEDAVMSAQSLCNKHVLKQGLEAVGMLSNCLPEELRPYKQTHLHHPCSKWTHYAKANYIWLVNHALAIFQEYTYRYNKNHKAMDALEICAKYTHKVDFTQDEMTPFAQAMPEKYKQDNVVKAYRAYYIGEKQHLGKWSVRPAPYWWVAKEKEEQDGTDKTNTQELQIPQGPETQL